LHENAPGEDASYCLGLELTAGATVVYVG
jgi:hypothetical protein